MHLLCKNKQLETLKYSCNQVFNKLERQKLDFEKFKNTQKTVVLTEWDNNKVFTKKKSVKVVRLKNYDILGEPVAKQHWCTFDNTNFFPLLFDREVLKHFEGHQKATFVNFSPLWKNELHIFKFQPYNLHACKVDWIFFGLLKLERNKSSSKIRITPCNQNFLIWSCYDEGFSNLSENIPKLKPFFQEP